MYVGNAARDGGGFRGWFVGHFVPASRGACSTGDLEIKWGIHRRGDAREAWGTAAEATSLSLLIRGAIRLFFSDGREVFLCTAGDYALWPAGVAHRWVIEADETVVLTVRWPSRPGNSADVAP